MPGTISLSNIQYGPVELYIRQGGNLRFQFDVSFSGTPPATFDYTVTMKDAAQQTVKTMTGTLATNGQSTVPVKFFAPPTKDAGGNLDFGGYQNHFKVEATGYDPHDAPFCTGCTCKPEKCGCDSPSCEAGGGGDGGGGGYGGGGATGGGGCAATCNVATLPPGRINPHTLSLLYPTGQASYGPLCGAGFSPWTGWSPGRGPNACGPGGKGPYG